MALTVREAHENDLAAIAGLTSAKRRQLARWEPEFWAMALGSDERHRTWLSHLVASSVAVTRVVDEDAVVVGFSAAHSRYGGWVVDDACVADGRWDDVGMTLSSSVIERPAVTCVPHADAPQACAFEDAGWTRVSQYRLLRLPGRGDPRSAGIIAGSPPVLDDRAVSTFQVDPHDPGALAFLDGDGGHIVGSKPFPAPGIYEPGGTTCVVDRLVGGEHPDRLLAALLGAAQARGDVQVLVVCPEDDDELRRVLDRDGWRHPVDVFEAAGGGPAH